MQLFEISHTDENFFLYVNQFIRKRHSSLIVDIIERSASIESDQIRSLNMPSSLSVTLRETITLRFVRDDFNKVIIAIIDVSLRQIQQMRFN
jgi:hypothetical protein